VPVKLEITFTTEDVTESPIEVPGGGTKTLKATSIKMEKKIFVEDPGNTDFETTQAEYKAAKAVMQSLENMAYEIMLEGAGDPNGVTYENNHIL